MSAPAGYPVGNHCECMWIGDTLAATCEAHKAWLRGVVASERAAEREACAKIAEMMGGDFIEADAVGDGYREARQAIATAIRNRR